MEHFIAGLKVATYPSKVRYIPESGYMDHEMIGFAAYPVRTCIVFYKMPDNRRQITLMHLSELKAVTSSYYSE